MSDICGGCNLIIKDQYMLNVLNKSWHSTCLKCHDCNIPQSDTLFYRDNMILCKIDFTK